MIHDVFVCTCRPISKTAEFYIPKNIILDIKYLIAMSRSADKQYYYNLRFAYIVVFSLIFKGAYRAR